MYFTKQYVDMLMNMEVEGIKILMENIQCHLIQTIHTINRLVSAINLTSGDLGAFKFSGSNFRGTLALLVTTSRIYR